MDGLLINSEDIITTSINNLLAKYERPTLTRSIRAQMMGITNSSNGDIFHDWAQLPISREEYAVGAKEEMHRNFVDCKPLPGAEKILSTLSRSLNSASGHKIELALASSTLRQTYDLKTSRPETKDLLNFIQPDRRILGDDPRVAKGKPAPDIYLVALQAINSGLQVDEMEIMPSECLVFEDSLVGVEAGRRAGMHVIWVPHPDFAVETEGLDMRVVDHRVETISGLGRFDYAKYGIGTI